MAIPFKDEQVVELLREIALRLFSIDKDRRGRDSSFGADVDDAYADYLDNLITNA